MDNLYQQLNADLQGGRDLVLARIISLAGSGPRAVGSACIIYPDGRFWGTVGGGLLEYRVLQAAPAVFEAGMTQILSIRMNGRDLARSEMVCGGAADIYLEPMHAEHRPTAALFSRAAELIQGQRQGVLYTRVADGIGADAADLRLLLLPDGSHMGSVGQSGDLTLAGWPGLIAAPGGNRLFVDPVAPDAVLYLFGGGHVATFVAPLAAQVGFRVAVIDDRAEFVSPERFPDVDQRHRLDFDTALERLPVTSRTYIAIMTRGHASDLTVVRGAVRTEAAYIGMMASSRKQRMIRDTLRREGVDDVRLDDVHTPIGVPIEAETPAEIAVSIVGELIRVRARRRSEGKA